MLEVVDDADSLQKGNDRSLPAPFDITFGESS